MLPTTTTFGSERKDARNHAKGENQQTHFPTMWETPTSGDTGTVQCWTGHFCGGWVEWFQNGLHRCNRWRKSHLKHSVCFTNKEFWIATKSKPPHPWLNEICSVRSVQWQQAKIRTCNLIYLYLPFMLCFFKISGSERSKTSISLPQYAAFYKRAE